MKVLVLFLAALLTLLAQQSDPTPPNGGGKPESVKTEITVTGTRTAMEVDRSPVSTSLITRSEMENRNIRQIDQALTLVEGVNAVRSKGPADNDFGLGLRGFSGRGGQSRTLILLDGQPINNSYIGNVPWSTFSVSEMERVEVVRGPFSSLYGGNAMGGVVNMITRPVDRRRVELFGQMGNRDTTNYSVSLADRFFNKLGLSFGYSRFQTGGYSPQEVLRTATTGTTGIPVTGFRRWLTPTGGTTYQVGQRGENWFNQGAYRVRAEYPVTDKLFASVQYMRQFRSDGWDAYSTLLRDAQGNPVDSGSVLINDGGITRRLTLTPVNFIGTPTGATVNIVQGQLLATLSPQWTMRMQGGMNQQPNDWYVTPGTNATLFGGTGDYVSQFNKAFYGNLQATRQGSGQGITFGAETRADRASIAARTIPNYAIRADQQAINSQAFGKAFNQAAYVQWQKSVGERFSLIAGGRWDYWRAYNGGNQTGLTAPVLRYPDRDTNALTGKVAATYQLGQGWLMRGSVGNAFRNPSIYDMYRNLLLSGIQFLANPQVNPERLFAYEGGVQKRFSGGHQLEATLYENRVSDLIYRTTDFQADPSGNIRRLTNAGLGRTRGVELALGQRPLGWLQLRQAYTFSNAIITENPTLPLTVGKRLPYVPRHTVTYFVTAAKSRWVSTWSGRYVGSTFGTDTNADTTRGVPGGYNPFFEMDVTGSYQIHRNVSIVASLDNVLDRRYYQFFLSQGRTFFGGLRFRLN
jgi:iron complex outermembrane recepter protein